jgi:2-keto-4-pentenoate hydratase/2-oxohepta-3-ene-1,7-dioic acid hydratase in catechol pathway
MPTPRPGKVVGTGLNYPEHAADLDADAPRGYPASFLKAGHTYVGPGDTIRVPEGIGRVTAEAEVGLVIGRECYRVGGAEALDFVAGITAILDQTAEDVLRQNPRYLTWSKNYPTFLSIGTDLVTLDEVAARYGSLGELRVATVHNGEVHRVRRVAEMTFGPAELVAFYSTVMPLHPGDLILTGTPGAVPIRPGDTVTCDLGDGLAVLSNPVGGPDD